MHIQIIGIILNDLVGKESNESLDNTMFCSTNWFPLEHRFLTFLRVKHP